MLRRLRNIGLSVGLTALALIVVPAGAAAHNVGHITLPGGQCLAIGSGREAPLVGQDRTQLDLVPQTPLPRDEYGVSFVGFGRNTPILPGPCPATVATATGDDSADVRTDGSAAGPFFSLGGE